MKKHMSEGNKDGSGGSVKRKIKKLWPKFCCTRNVANTQTNLAYNRRYIPNGYGMANIADPDQTALRAVCLICLCTFC